jgi:hypothetical protein
MTTRWNCERCGADGAVRHKPAAGVWEVYQQVADAHQRKSDRIGLRCDTGTSRVRVRIVARRKNS